MLVADFAFDDDNIDKLWAHGVRPSDVLDVLESEYVIVPNRRNRQASHLLIGRDRAGRCLAIPIEPTYDDVVWRPVTAWLCKPRERSLMT